MAKNKTKQKSADVVYGLGYGVTAVTTGGILGFGVYELQGLLSVEKIGKTVTPKAVDPNSPVVRIYFRNIDAITAEIRRLQSLRRRIRKQVEEQAEKPRDYCGAV